MAGNELKARITLDTAMLARGLQQSQAAVRNWSQNLKSHIATAFSAAAITAAMRSTIDSLQGMGDAGDRMGRTVEEVQMLAQMAQLAGSELSKVEQILMNISEAQIDALGGNTKKLDMFGKAGISRDTLNSTNELGILQMMAGNLQGKTTSGLRSVLSDLIGKKNVGAFQAMQGDLSDFSGALANKKQQGFIVPTETVLKLKQASDELAVSWDNLWKTLTINLGPAIADVVQVTTSLVDVVSTWGSIAADLMSTLMSSIRHPTQAKANIEKFMTDADNKLFGLVARQFERDARVADIGKRAKEAQENANAGPNIPDTNKKGFRFAVDESVFGSNSKLAGPKAMELYQSTGGFAGSDMRMISSVNVETNMILKQQLAIQKKILEESAKFALNTGADIMSIFGIGK